MRTTSVLATAALVGTAVLVATPASAAPLVCGSTVTVSTSLTTDLTCTGPAPALTLGAGVTLNLKGHTVSGPGTGVGILVPQDGDVVIRNGTLTGWSAGVDTGGPVDEPRTGTVAVDRLTVTDSGTGVDASGELPFSGGKATTVTRSRFERVGTGIDASWFADVWVSASTFSDATVGLRVDTSFADVSGSTFRRNGTAIAATEGAVDVHGSSFVDNTAGVRLFFMGAATVDASTFRGNDVAVDAGGFVPQLVLTGNTFTTNTEAVELGDVDGTISSNVFRRNGSGVHGQSTATTSLVVQGNVLHRNGDAIVFDAADANTSLGGNTATRNSGWGIYAPGVTDLGGNAASGNGNSPQCVGVSCS
ncbi:right-handed parallel beta-helix repeat-containing protein [Cellulomonas terrae]|uniref:Right handed beta helix domain-containing protein n=1 Tax=Cellulomonas terrae TaxID=311234 RepID=A0A511JQS6_9CELL|nr:right-handed parallel beta-helix repeat-containing protein [Cellulomonas terrae]GEM00383.1 hypothetical protein CTE05_39290 [Cellulomonas terrae]